MNFIVHMHAIPPIWHTHQAEDRKQVRLELKMYFDKLMCMLTSTHSEIIIDTMHQYVDGLSALKMMMHMLSDELDKGAISMYADATKARVFFQQDVTIKHMNTITNNEAWH